MPDKSYLYAVSIMVGTAVGAGIFGLPYAASKSGFVLVFALIVVLGVITLILNLMYGEVTLRTKKKSNVVGYAGKYLGKSGKKIAALINLFSLYSAMLAYIIIGGIFLNLLLSAYFGGNDFIYSLVIFSLISTGIYFGLRLIGLVEFLMSAFLLLAMALIIIRGMPFINVGNLLSYDFSQSFFPFGVVLFSFGALSAIPELEQMITEKQERIRSAIIAGTAIPAVVYLVFTAVVLGITGSGTSEEGISGLGLALRDGIVVPGLIFGILAIATSYLVIGINLKEIFWYDYNLSERKSWALACLVPFVVFALGLRDFITVVSMAGSIAGGLVGILIIIVFYRAKKTGDIKPAYEIKVPIALSAVIIFIFLLGIAYQFIYRN